MPQVHTGHSGKDGVAMDWALPGLVPSVLIPDEIVIYDVVAGWVGWWVCPWAYLSHISLRERLQPLLPNSIGSHSQLVVVDQCRIQAEIDCLMGGHFCPRERGLPLAAV
jgi:hypothetical protein